MRRDREPFYSAPPKNPLPPNKMQDDRPDPEKGYTRLAQAQRGQPRQPIADRDYGDGPWTGEQFSDR